MARQAYALRNTDAATGLKNLIEAIRQTKERCEKRKQDAQMKRGAEAMKEIESYRRINSADTGSPQRR